MKMRGTYSASKRRIRSHADQVDGGEVVHQEVECNEAEQEDVAVDARGDDVEAGGDDMERAEDGDDEAEVEELPFIPLIPREDERAENSFEEEEFVDRYEYEIEEEVAAFVDEEFIGHNVIPESSDEDDDALVIRNRRMRMNSKDKLAIGTAYYSGLEFKEAVLEYALTRGKNIRQDRWDKTKLSFKCGMEGKCQWRVYCSFDQSSGKWLVKSRYRYHSCTPNGKCKLLKSPVIANLFMDKLREDSDLMPQKIQDDIKEIWKIVASRNQCQRGRLVALRRLKVEYDEQFSHLHGYVNEIHRSNPGSTAVLETISNAGLDVFNRFYVCFERLRSTWRTNCRPIIGLDGTFLKQSVKGILLTAVGHDANNQIYPVAWAIVQAENTDNWLWFIKLLKVDLCLQDGNNCVLISDSSKGLISAIKSELPMGEHRRCVKHILENLKKKHKGKDLLKPMIWSLAWSYNPTQFEENLQKVKDYNMSLYEDVMREDPKSWSLAFYRLGSCCEDVDNNATESFNATIIKARGKAIVPMLETIRRQAMIRIAKRSKKSLRRMDRFTKYVVDMLESEKGDAQKCRTIPATYGVFEVVLFGNAYDVNTTRRTCSCGKWQITGIPCEHAYGAMIDASLDPENYVSEFFSTFMWQETYRESISTVRGPRFWMKGIYRLITMPPEPTLPGRKKKSKQNKFPRKKGKHESPKKKKKQKETLGRVGRVIRCSKCGTAGHNANGCKIHPKKKMKMTREDAHSEQVLTQPSQTSSILFE